MFENNKCKVSHCGTIIAPGRSYCSVHKSSKETNLDCKNSYFQDIQGSYYYDENGSSVSVEMSDNKRIGRFFFRPSNKKKSKKLNKTKIPEINYCRFYNCYAEVRSKGSLCSAHKKVVDDFSIGKNKQRSCNNKTSALRKNFFNALKQKKDEALKVIYSEYKAFLEILSIIYRSINFETLLVVLFCIVGVGLCGFFSYQAILLIEKLVSNFTKDHFFVALVSVLSVFWFIGLFIDEKPNRNSKKEPDDDSLSAKCDRPSYNYHSRNYRNYGTSEGRERNTGLKNLSFNLSNIKRIPEYRAGVYIIKCKTNGRTYVGESTNLKRRLGDHLSSLQRNNHESKKKKKRIKLQSDFNEFGAGQFLFGILEYTDNYGTGRRWNIESGYIRKFNAVSKGYNSLSHQNHYTMYVNN